VLVQSFTMGNMLSISSCDIHSFRSLCNLKINLYGLFVIGVEKERRECKRHILNDKGFLEH